MTTLTSAEVCRLAFITYRQLDYWTKCGYVHAVEPTGSGYRRFYDDDEARICALIATLAHAGVTVPRAAKVARSGSYDKAEIFVGRLGYRVNVEVFPTRWFPRGDTGE